MNSKSLRALLFRDIDMMIKKENGREIDFYTYNNAYTINKKTLNVYNTLITNKNDRRVHF